MKATVYSVEKKKVGEVDLKDEIFGVPDNRPLLYDMVKQQLAGRREGTAFSRNHTLVSGTTAKMYRQKGTGRARHGDARTNIFVGGGKAFGPKQRDYSYRMPRKARRQSLRVALAMKQREERLLVVDALTLPKPKTKEAVAMLKALGVKSVLFVVANKDESFERSVRNLPNVKLIRSEGINVYDLLRYEHAVITKDALASIETSLLKE